MVQNSDDLDFNVKKEKTQISKSLKEKLKEKEISDKNLMQNSTKHVSRAVLYSFLKSYGIVPLSLLLPFILSRIIPADIWGILLYSLILISGARIFLIFFPPSVDAVMLYKTPELFFTHQESKVKGLLNYTILSKTIVSSLVAAGYLIFAWILHVQNPDSYYPIIIAIETPIIIKTEIQIIFTNLFNAMKKYNLPLYLLIMEKVLFLIGYIVLYFLPLSIYEKLIYIATLNTFIHLFYLVIDFILYMKYFHKYKAEKIDWNAIKETITFGSNFSVASAANYGYLQVYSGSINYFGVPQYNTFNNIFTNLTSQATMAFSLPIGPVLSDLETADRRDYLYKLLKRTIVFSSVLSAFIIGLLYFGAGIYILVLYPPEYMEIIPLLKTYVFIIYFINIINIYRNLFSTTKHEDKIWKITLIGDLLLSILAIIGMKYFLFTGIIISKVIGYGIFMMLFWKAGKKVFPLLKISLINILFIFGLLIGVVFISSIFYDLFINTSLYISIQQNLINITIKIWNNALIYSEQIGYIIDAAFGIIIFSLLFLFGIIIFRVITRDDIIRFENINMKIPMSGIIFCVAKKIFLPEKKVNTMDKKNNSKVSKIADSFNSFKQ